ncbi:MAG: zinc ABC transporter substrate-binding protein [Bacteroidetes bacterium]|nr:zinc ABC transporter substrate-binding protein [Bacteroidota bacterium]
MKNRIYSILAALTLISCRIEPKEQQGPLHIVATTGIIEDGLLHIVGDSAEVSSIMGPGTDPHIYKPTPGDIELLDDADVIVCNGLHLEGKMAEMLDKYAKEKPVLKVSDGIAEKDLIKSVDLGDSYDPHIWFDTQIWMQGLKYIATELGKIDSTSAAYYTGNFNRYQKEAEELDEWVFTQLDSLDTNHRVLITSHDAFSYFGRRYNVEVRGIQGISTLSEVGLKEISDMVDFIIQRQIAALFVETSTSQKTAESIVDGCRARNYELRIEGPLYSDAMGEPDTDAGNYLGMIRANVSMIVKGLRK